MARLASAADFEGLAPDAMYEAYRRYPFFAHRARYVQRLVDRLKQTPALPANSTPATTHVVVVGAGWGFLVDELMALGFDAYGIEASAYAHGKAAEHVPSSVHARMHQKDGLSAVQFTEVRRAAGLKGGQLFDLGISEDILPCLDDQEVMQLRGIMRGQCRNLLHIITPGAPGEPKVTALNWKTMADWRTLLATGAAMPSWLLNAEGDCSDPAIAATLEYPPDGWVEP
jgi:hypothetical protein